MGSPNPWRAIAYSVRQIPHQFGLRPFRVYVVVSQWSGEMPGRGTKSTYETEIVESGSAPPKVRFVSEEQRALGNLAVGAVTIGPITPDHGANGTAFDVLMPTATMMDGQTAHIKLVGPPCPNGALYAVKEVKTDRALHWTIVAEPVEKIA